MIVGIVIPFFNEEKNIEDVVDGLSISLGKAGIDYRLILVNNGSTDGSARIFKRLERDNPEKIAVVTVPKNQGFGWGIINGLAKTKEKYIGFMGGDGQIDPDDVVRVIDTMENGRYDLVQVNRVVRDDGLSRKILSFIFNYLFRLLFRVSSNDINGSPKIMRGELLDVIKPESRDWFIDAEILIKAKYLNLKIGEVAIEFLRREKGSSHIKVGTITEFLLNMVRYKFGRGLRQWRKTV